MSRRTSYIVALLSICVVLLEILTAVDTFAAETPKGTRAPDLRTHPTGGKTPVDIAVGLFVTNIVAIDETRETFEVGGYLIGKWKDARLALPPNLVEPSEQNPVRVFRVEDVWTPPIEAANSISHKTNSYVLEADRNGEVTYIERFDAVLSSDFALRKFPFDTQVLSFEFQPFLSPSAMIRFPPQALPSTGISAEQHTELAAWHVKELRYNVEKIVKNGLIPETGEALFQIVIERRSGFYIWKIFLPLLIMTLIPTVVFWIDVKEFDWLLKIPMTMLLAMVAFEFAVARDLPRIGYITLLDAVFLVSFVFCFLCVCEILLAYLMNGTGQRPTALKLRQIGRWLYPIGYFGALLLLAVIFLR
jgi:hypothetical protein